MALLGTLQVRMGLDAATFSQKFNSFTKDLQKKANSFQRSLSGLTSFGNLGASLGAGSALTSIIKTSAEFETSLNQVGAATDATGAEMTKLEALALQMGRSTVFSANQSAGAMLELAKAGMTPAQMAAGALAGTIQLASTEGMELSRSAVVMSDAMNAFKLKAEDSANIADVLAGASIASTAGVEDLAQALAQTSAVSSIAGFSLNETAGALALFASNGIKGSDAGTSLKTMLLRLVPQTKAAATAMDIYGISFTNANGSFKSMTEVASILQQKLGKLGDAQRQSALQAIFGTDAMRAAALFTREGSAELQRYITATEDKNAAEKLSEARTKGAGGAMIRLSNAISTLAISIGKSGVLEIFTDLTNRAINLVNRLAESSDSVKKLAVGFMAAATVLPPFALALSSIVTAIPSVLAGIGMVAGFLTGPWGIAIGAAVGAFVLFKTEILAGVASVKQWFQDWQATNTNVILNLQDAWAKLQASFGPMFVALGQALTNFKTEILKAFGADAASAMQSFGQLAASALTGFVQWVTRAVEGVTNFVQWLTAKLPEAGTIAGQAVGTLKEWFGKVREFVQPAIDAIKSAGDVLGALGNVFSAVGELINTIWAAAFKKIVTDTGIGKAAIEVFQYTVDGVKEVVVTWAEICADAFQWVAREAKALYDKAVAPLNNFATKIREMSQALRDFTGVGEETTDKAVGHSWLTDLCEQGVTWFQSFITGGVNPAMRALGGFSKAGEAVKPIGFTSDGRGILKALPVKDLAQGPKELQGAWKIALDNVGRTIDDFVRGGKVSFKDLIRSFVADLASAQLKKAAEALFSGIAGMFTGGGGGASGGWGSVLSSVLGAFGSFEGGGYTGGGSRAGGLDGRGGRLAMLHPRETVIDHTAVKAGQGRGGARGVTVNTPITLMPGVSHEELANIMPVVQQNIIRLIPELIARGGSYARAFNP